MARLLRGLVRTAALAAVAIAAAGCGPAPTGTTTGGIPVAQLLGGTAAEGFERAIGPRAFEFPSDHGPHPGFRTEWWYFTGNLTGPGGDRYGFQLTFFRNALSPTQTERSSAWAATQVYMAHFAVTDGRSGRFLHYERFARGALGLAGAQAEPFRVHLEDWQAASVTAATFPLRLLAREDAVSLDLTLDQGKPPVLQGERGLSRKGSDEGNASYYYSKTRMPARGTLTIGGEEVRVEGLAWMDREWSTSALDAGQVGWDWFALQLDDGTDLMFYRLRREGGAADIHSKGSWVMPDGTSRTLRVEQVELEVLDRWPSPRGGVYPSRWRIDVPGEGLTLELTPLALDQELTGTVRYWEGAVTAKGTRGGVPIAGRGYVEMTGYAGEGL